MTIERKKIDKDMFDKFKEEFKAGDLVKIVKDIPVEKPSCPSLDFQELKIGDVGAITKIWEDGAVRFSLGDYTVNKLPAKSFFNHERRKRWEGYGTVWFEAIELVHKMPENCDNIPCG